MVGTGLKVLIADTVLLLAEFFVIQDVQARVGCALGSTLYGSPCLTRASPGYAYSLFTESFSMVINGTGVLSPMMLDWVQLIAALLIAINVWYVYVVIKRKPGRANEGPQVPSPA